MSCLRGRPRQGRRGLVCGALASVCGLSGRPGWEAVACGACASAVPPGRLRAGRPGPGQGAVRREARRSGGARLPPQARTSASCTPGTASSAPCSARRQSCSAPGTAGRHPPAAGADREGPSGAAELAAPKGRGIGARLLLRGPGPHQGERGADAAPACTPRSGPAGRRPSPGAWGRRCAAVAWRAAPAGRPQLAHADAAMVSEGVGACRRVSRGSCWAT
jgi:hypothetical protein